MDKLSDITLILLLVLGLIGIPSFYMNMSMENKVYSSVNNETMQFKEKILNKGYISQKDYDNFLNSLSNTGKIYRVELKHTETVYYPLKPTDDGYSVEMPYKEVEFEYFNETIFESIYSKTDPKNYEMSVGDFFSIKVYSNENFLNRIFGHFFGVADSEELIATYGGMIVNE